jgi:SAM-dependent methyltransferase
MRLYGDLAPWFHLLTHPADYAEEAEYYTRAIESAMEGEARTLLELGCGGGNNASYLKRRFTCTLTDLSESMLHVSRGLDPECEHIQGDMRSLRLGRTFDAVFVHDAIAYMTTEDDLRAAIETAAVHTRPGGVALFVPDTVRETFEPGTHHGGHDGEDGRALRYLEWTRDADPGDTAYEVDYAVILREPDGSTRVADDRHRCGLFPRATWLRFLAEAGFDIVPPPEPDPFEGMHNVFVGRRRAPASASR